MTPDADGYAAAEIAAAPKTLTSHLFHYTSAESALFGILNSGTLRLSPFETTNDLWESRQTFHPLSAHDEDLGAVEGDAALTLWGLIDRHIRVNAKVACLTTDWELPPSVIDSDAHRGWAHLSLWAHYGAGHTGICLRFDRDALVDSLESSAKGNAQVFHGPVDYKSISIGPVPGGIDVGQILEFGVDAVAMALVRQQSRSIFFEKHQDWAPEREYRLVRMDDSTLPFTIDIRSALTAVVLGDAFPKSRIPPLREILSKYHHVEVQQVRYQNRRLMLMPAAEVDFSRTQSEARPTSDSAARGSDLPWISARRSGELEERVEALLAAEAAALESRANAAGASEELMTALRTDMRGLANGIDSWTHDGIDAIPPRLRSRRPGVTGERVHYEAGLMIVHQREASSRRSVIASVALQVLDGDWVRLHAQVRTEGPCEGVDQRTELWRGTRSTELKSAQAVWSDDLLVALRKAVARAIEH